MHRLAGQDAYFLYQETPSALMHTLKISVCKPGASQPSEADFRELVRRSMGCLPVFQYRVVPVPLGLHHPVVVNDGGFDYDMHVHRIAVPAPGARAQLDQVIGEIAAGLLERSRPLWEIWVLEGLEGGRIAYVNKMHHVLADGVAAVNYLGKTLYRDPTDIGTVGLSVFAREEQPSAQRLVLDALRDLLRDFLRLPRLLQDSARRRRLIDARNRVARLVPAAPYSPDIPKLRFNRALSNLRNYATAQYSLADFRTIKNRLGGTVNDVMLGMLAGGLRRYLQTNAELPERPLVCAIPVSAEQEAAATRTSGNNVAYFHMRLRTDIADPCRRYAATQEAMAAGKELLDLLGRNTFHSWACYIPPLLYTVIQRLKVHLRLAERGARAMNLIVSNVPGPRYGSPLADFEVEELYSGGPLMEGVGLNITAWSFRDQLNFGLVACRRAVPDLPDLAGLLRQQHAILLDLARQARHAAPDTA